MYWNKIFHPSALLMTVCLLCTSRLVGAGFERSCSSNRHNQGPKGICGNHLSTILSMVCRMYNKRSDPALGSVSDRESKLIKDQKNDIFLQKEEALSMFKREINIQGTITCECCIHRCQIGELRQYCSVAEPFKKRNADMSMPMAGETKHHNAKHEKQHPGQATIEEDDDLDRMQQEVLDIARKQKIGKEILRHAPTWWEAFNTLSTTEHVQENSDITKEALP